MSISAAEAVLEIVSAVVDASWADDDEPVVLDTYVISEET